MIYITNGFSPSMLKLPADVEFKEVSKDEFCDAASKGVNAIGHAGTIDLLSNSSSTLNVTILMLLTVFCFIR